MAWRASPEAKAAAEMLGGSGNPEMDDGPSIEICLCVCSSGQIAFSRRAEKNELKQKGAEATAMLAITQLQLRSTEGKLAKTDLELQEQTEKATSTKAELAKTQPRGISRTGRKKPPLQRQSLPKLRDIFRKGRKKPDGQSAWETTVAVFSKRRSRTHLQVKNTCMI